MRRVEKLHIALEYTHSASHILATHTESVVLNLGMVNLAALKVFRIGFSVRILSKPVRLPSSGQKDVENDAQIASYKFSLQRDVQLLLD